MSEAKCKTCGHLRLTAYQCVECGEWVPRSTTQPAPAAKHGTTDEDAERDAQRYRLIRDSGDFAVYAIDDGDDGTGVKESEVQPRELDHAVDNCPSAILVRS